MATYRPQIETEGFDFDTSWKEGMATQAPGGSDAFSNRSGDATIVVYLEPADPRNLAGLIRSAMWNTLGYSWADDAAPWELHRVAPASHPIYGPSYRATSVGFQLIGPRGNPDNPNNQPWVNSEVVLDTVTRHGNYAAAWMTARFAGPLPYYLFEDDSDEWSGLEQDRYTVVDVQPKVEAISATNTKFLFFVDGPTNDPRTQPFPGEVYERVVRAELTCDWFEVPRTYLFDADNKPQRVLNCLGRVNSQPLLGYPKQCLLLEGVRLERQLFPFYSDDGRAFYYDVRLYFNFCDPKPGTGSSTTDRGWRLLPWRMGGNATGNDGATGGAGWYAVRRGGTSVSNPTYLEEIDMASVLFKHVGDT